MPIAKKKDIPLDFINQMKENLTKTQNPISDKTSEKSESLNYQTGNTGISTFNNAPAEKNTLSLENAKKEKYADVMNIRLSKGRRNEIKAFCTNCGVTVTQFIESSFEFLAREFAAGNISISKGGITRIN